MGISQKVGRPCTKSTGGNTSTNPDDRFLLAAQQAHGELCQWYPANFTISKAKLSSLVGYYIDGDDPEGWQPVYFNFAEQFMMYCKAGRFHDSETQKLMFATHDPKEQKRLARLTKGLQATS